MTLDPELQVFEQFALPDFSDVAVVRKWAHAFAAKAAPVDAALTRAVTITEQTIPGPSSAPPVPIRLYRPRSAGLTPGLLYFHGGSFLMGDLNTDHLACLKYVRDAHIAIVSVQYRLAPEHRFPAGVEDCYAALVWLAENAGKLGIDAGRIALGGSSAGGTLAAAVAIMSRDRHGPKPRLQMLIYPALDDRMITPSVNSSARQYGVTRAVIGHMWRYYLGAPGIANSPYAAPARITDFTDLAPAYIETCELDPLRDEVIEYAARMLQAGISTDFRVIAGAPHAFDMVSSALVTQQAFAGRARALRKAFGTSVEGQ